MMKDVLRCLFSLIFFPLFLAFVSITLFQLSCFSVLNAFRVQKDLESVEFNFFFPVENVFSQHHGGGVSTKLQKRIEEPGNF